MGSAYDPLRGCEIGDAAPRACSTCPWRVEIQENPPEGFTRLEGAEGARTLRALWEGGIYTLDWEVQGIRKGIKDGNAAVCHRADAVLNPELRPPLVLRRVTRATHPQGRPADDRGHDRL